MKATQERRLSDTCKKLVSELFARLGDGEHHELPNWTILIVTSREQGQLVKVENGESIFIIHCYGDATTLVATKKRHPEDSLELVFRPKEPRPWIGPEADWIREKIASLRM